jgi:hypothetical protein
MDSVTVITEAVRAEGRKWEGLGDRMTDIKKAVDRLHLAAPAFFIGDVNFALYSARYNHFQWTMSNLIGAAATEFHQVGVVLRRIADHYDRTDEIVEGDLNKIFSA